jgi:SlyX protein
MERLPTAMLSTEQRLMELETRLAFQEHALAELSDALAASRIETARNAELLRRALDDMKQSRGEFFADPAAEPPPPHY